MTETTQNYYYVESDRDLLKLLFDQLPCQSLEDLLQLLDQKHIASFKDILDYASGPDCPNDLSLTIEVAMDRLRRTDMRRSSDWAGSSKIGNYLANKLLGQKQEQFWVLYFDQQQNLLGEKMLFQGTLTGPGFTPEKSSAGRWSTAAPASSWPTTIPAGR